MGKGQNIALYITICCVAFIASKIIITVLCYKRWKRKQLVYEDGFSGIVELHRKYLFPHLVLSNKHLLCFDSGGKMVMFKSAIMKSLTSDTFLKKTLKLSNKDIIGSGGYGTVYRLSVNESTAFAVKRLNRGTAERERGFERELKAMGDIKHRNIVTLHGYCITHHYNLLIYELMPNGSLDSFLHGM